jgi:anti-sigma regulatory factor (Ser/Thr protein kinase)
LVRPLVTSPDPSVGDPFPVPPAPLQKRAFGIDDLWSLRRFVSARASEELLDNERSESLVLAVNELASNSVRHGGGTGTLLMWREADALVCEVRDHGYLAHLPSGCPEREAFGGRGLWLVSMLCDQVQVHSSPAGSAVRVHMHSN